MPERYTPEQAAEEAERIQSDVERGRASNYPEAESKLEAEKLSKLRSILKDIEKTREREEGRSYGMVNAVRVLVWYFKNDSICREIAPELMKIGLNQGIRYFKNFNFDNVKDESDYEIFGHQPAHIAISYYILLTESQVPSLEDKWREIGKDLMKVRAAYLEVAGKENAVEWYKFTGLLSKANDIQKKVEEGTFTDTSITTQQPFISAIREFYEKYKDFELLSVEEENAILDDAKQKVEAQLARAE